MRRVVFHGMRFLILALLFFGVFSAVVMLLWNGLMPHLFRLSEITYLQAMGLLVLSHILFGGFRRAGGGRWPGRAKFVHGWKDLTPEERERFAVVMRGRCAPEPPPSAAPGA